MLVSYSEDSGMEAAARLTSSAHESFMLGLISGFVLGATAARLEASENGTGGKE
jgi:hypothetical protein